MNPNMQWNFQICISVPLRDYVSSFCMMLGFHGYDVITFENAHIVVIVPEDCMNKDFGKVICRF